MPKKICLVGQKIGRLLVIAELPRRKRRTINLCKCDCGNEKVVDAQHLRGKTINSCGCLRVEIASARMKTHGQSHNNKTKTYSCWKGMLYRCRNPNCKKFKDYGGRGIKVCQRWFRFENFFADMGPIPSNKHSIERIENGGDYTPENCTWATAAEQNRNKRSNIVISVRGKTGCLKEICYHFGVKYGTTYRRIKRGLEPEQAFFMPVHSKQVPY